jgi:hypothetical protein
MTYGGFCPHRCCSRADDDLYYMQGHIVLRETVGRGGAAGGGGGGGGLQQFRAVAVALWACSSRWGGHGVREGALVPPDGTGCRATCSSTAARSSSVSGRPSRSL